MSFARYPKYKASGIAWLGIVPAHWKVFPLKRLGVLQAGAGFPHDEQGLEGEELPFFKVGALGQVQDGDLLVGSDSSISRETALRLRAFVFPPGTIVFAKIGAALMLGRLRMLGCDACIDNNLMGVLPDASLVEPTYLRYAMHLIRFELIANPGAVPSVSEGSIARYMLPVPPLTEQRKLLAFLDRELSRIDALVAEQRRLIELLAEKCEAIVSRAVTGGLDPRAKMRTSRLEWLGEIPSHWQVLPLNRLVDDRRRITYGIVQPGEPDPEGRYMVRGQDYSNGWVAAAEIFRVANVIEAPYRRARLASMDLVMTIVGAGVGNVAVVPDWLDGANITQTTARIAIDPAVADPTFVKIVLQSRLGRHSVGKFAKGAAQPGLNLEHVRTFPVPVPPLDEQQSIVRYVETELAAYGDLMRAAAHAISALQARRTALISAAVTGQIDVRNFADAEREAA